MHRKIFVSNSGVLLCTVKFYEIWQDTQTMRGKRCVQRGKDRQKAKRDPQEDTGREV